MVNTLIVTTRDFIENKTIKRELGIVSGSSVKSRMFLRDILANIRDFFGWEIKEYSKLIIDTQKDSIKRMCEQAEQLGANAVVGVRFVTTEVKANCAEIIAYGTAVEVT